MAITQAVCTSFKEELLNKEHDLDTDTFKIALYTEDATLGAGTTAYTTTEEISGTGYSAGGATLTGGGIATDGTTAFVDFADPSWAGATFTARGALIYNSSNSNKAVCVLDFSDNFTASSETFSIGFPTADLSNALIRLL